MTDYLVSVGLQTQTGAAKRDVEAVASSIDKVGTAATSASRGTEQLETASRKLADAQRAVADADAAVARMQDRTGSNLPKIIGNQNDYNKALHAQWQARVRLAQAIKDGQDAETKAAHARPKSGGSEGGPSTKSIATGVGLGVAAAKAGEVIADKAREFVFGSIEQASKLSDTLVNNGQVFGGYARQIDEFGKSAAGNLGLSRQAALEAADAFGALFHGAGVGDDQSAGLSTGLTKLGVDLAAFKQEADPGQAFHALQQAVSGQYDGLHQYGIVLTSATVRDEAFRLGLIRTRTEALNPQATAIAAATLASEKAQAQTGAFARSTDELSGKQQVLSANIKNAQADLGKGLMPLMSGAADVAEGTLVPALTGVGKAIQFIGENDLTRTLTEIAIGMYALTVAVNVTTAAYGRLAGAAGTAALAEGEAAAGGVAAGAGRAGVLLGAARTGALGLGTKTVIGASLGLATVIGTEPFRGDQRDQLRQGARARGHSLGFDPFASTAGEDITHRTGGFLKTLGLIRVSRALDNATGYTADMAAFARKQAEEQKKQQAAIGIALSGPVGKARAASDVADYNVRGARAYLDSRSYVKDAANVPIGGLLDALPEKPDQSGVQNARDALKSAQSGVAIAQARARQARAGSGGASGATIAGLRASVLTAEDAVRRRGGNPAAEALRLQAAQGRLNAALAGGKTNTVAVMNAEKSLADARSKSRRAADELHKAEKAASGDKSLTLKEVLARATHSAGTATAEAGNVKTLVKKGLTQPVISELEQLEQTAPGTIAKVAKGLTPAYVKQLNADAKARTQAALDIARLGGIANLQALEKEAYAAGNRLGAAVNKGYRDGIDPHGVPKAGPAPSTAPPVTTSNPQPGGVGDFLGQQAGAPKGVAVGVTPAAPVAVVPHAAHPPRPVIVSPRTTHNHNNFPNVKTTAQQRAELDKLERLDAMR